jgi:hypothetical protein
MQQYVGLREDVLSLPAQGGGQVRLRVSRLTALLLRISAVHQVQITPRPGGLHVRVALRDSAPAGDVVPSVMRTLQRELHRAEAIVETLTVQAVRQGGTNQRIWLVR